MNRKRAAHPNEPSHEYYYEDEDGEEVPDILVVAKFAQMDVSTDARSHQPAPSAICEDPNEIRLEQSNDQDQESDSESSSSSSSSSESEVDDAVNEGEDSEKEDEDDEDVLPKEKDDNVIETEISSIPLEPLPPQEWLLPEDKIAESLKVTTLQKDFLVAAALGTPVLDFGSVVCTKNRLLLGRVDEVFGPVTSPFYTVRIMNTVVGSSIQVGEVLCWVERLSQFVNCAALNSRGTDASNMQDEEFSEAEDDEDDSSYDGDGVIEDERSNELSANRFQSAPSNLNVRNQPSARAKPVPSKSTPSRSRGGRRGNSNSNRPPVSVSFAAPSLSSLPNLPAPQAATPAPSQPMQSAALPPGWPAPKLPPGWPVPRF